MQLQRKAVQDRSRALQVLHTDIERVLREVDVADLQKAVFELYNRHVDTPTARQLELPLHASQAMVDARGGGRTSSMRAPSGGTPSVGSAHSTGSVLADVVNEGSRQRQESSLNENSALLMASNALRKQNARLRNELNSALSRIADAKLKEASRSTSRLSESRTASRTSSRGMSRQGSMVGRDSQMLNPLPRRRSASSASRRERDGSSDSMIERDTHPTPKGGIPPRKLPIRARSMSAMGSRNSRPIGGARSLKPVLRIASRTSDREERDRELLRSHSRGGQMAVSTVEREREAEKEREREIALRAEKAQLETVLQVLDTDPLRPVDLATSIPPPSTPEQRGHSVRIPSSSPIESLATH
ncbi:hypothetical protein KIPB_007827, partial [Kipferlia bialata]|eukprot:g7827.t1